MAAARISLMTRSGEVACEVTGVPADLCTECGKCSYDPLVAQHVQHLLAEDVPSGPPQKMLRLQYREKRIRVELPATLHDPHGVPSEVHVVNLNSCGAMIEHAVILSPGAGYVLRLHLGKEEVRLPARIRWRGINASKSTAGRKALPFRSGLCFAEGSEVAQARIRRFVNAARGTKAS